MGKQNFYIADTHFDHNNIIKFDNRPFLNCEEMNETIIANWNSVVHNNDNVYILGDFCWGKEDRWKSLLSQLKGVKILIKGNHDLKQYSSSLKKCFSDIKDYKEIIDHNRKVILSHYPIFCYKSSYNPNVFMLFGHVHRFTQEAKKTQEWIRQLKNESKESNVFNKGQLFNVGCMIPYMNYTPRTLNEIIEGAVSNE